MTTQNFSIEDLAISLIDRLDRRNIFPPQYNNPETFISTNTNNLSLRRPRRPPNAFLLCRKNVHQEAKRKGTCNMRVISKVTGILWRNASPEEKGVYERLADRVNEIHSKRTTIIYKPAIGSSSFPNKARSSYKPYMYPSQLNVPSVVPLNAPLLLPVPNPSHSITQPSLNISPTFDQEEHLFQNNPLNNTINHFNPLEFNNQVPNDDHNFLSLFYNSILMAPSSFS
ncbi:9062_t:CDS:1 [Funneliformis geosporum]|uniref:10283_t:CDS:1 n=1 Tax=Funneliformis geosporum TaxID=1117311 RepID=A0A9W4SAH8_9GLOM|nr:10283_t:CDS:1 [Funneliformis geosporum]CAI2161515.1 9062_t:CDS:1 [Funneliformis geosporum]